MTPSDTAAQRSTVTYQELADLEAEFDDFNAELRGCYSAAGCPLPEFLCRL
jgi:hypothetical protein